MYIQTVMWTFVTVFLEHTKCTDLSKTLQGLFMFSSFKSVTFCFESKELVSRYHLQRNHHCLPSYPMASYPWASMLLQLS